MDAFEVEQIIRQAGGNIELAKLLGLEIKGGTYQRIHNWKKRGLPARIILDNQEKIKELAARAAAQ